MNLLPAERRIRQTRWAYVPAVVLGLATIALLVALGFHQMVQDRTLIRKLDQEIQSLKAPVERVQSIRNQADELEKSIQSVEDILRKRDMNLEILQELTTILPPDTFLSTYNNRDGTIQLTGVERFLLRPDPKAGEIIPIERRRAQEDPYLRMHKRARTDSLLRRNWRNNS